MILKVLGWVVAVAVLIVSSLGYLSPGSAAVMWSMVAVCALFNFATNVLVDRVYTEQRSLHGGKDVLIGVSKVVINRSRS